MIAIAATVIFAAMIGEAMLAARNERALRSGGALEPHDDVYRIMRIAYPACFVVLLVEGAARAIEPGPRLWIGAAVFAAGKIVKYWAIATLGPRWTFRVLVPRDGARFVHVSVVQLSSLSTPPTTAYV